MEVMTLLKANIRHKKGSFVSIILLMIIISMSFTSVLSLHDNIIKSIKSEMNRVDVADFIAMIKENQLTDEILQNVKNNDMVKSVSMCPALITTETCVGEEIYTSPWFMRKLDTRYRVIKDNLSGYQKDIPELSDGEIYVTLGIKTAMECEKGDTVKIKTDFGDYQFKIKGFIAEPVSGSFTIGWKQVFISNDDYDRISAKYEAGKTEEKCGNYVILSVKQSEKCHLSQIKFRRQLNLDTGISNQSLGSFTKEQSMGDTSLYIKILIGVLTTFIIILLTIVLIVIKHSIITTIEMNYEDIGILKAQGFTSWQIRLVFILEYLSAQLLGAFLGTMLAMPLTRILGNVFVPIVAICIQPGMSVLKVLCAIFTVLLISAVFIVLATGKVVRISPVSAISGCHDDIYFDSRLNVTVNKKFLSGSLALRQFTYAKHHYTGILLIVSLLVFFMMTVMVLGNILTSKSTMESLGMILGECKISYTEKVDDQKLEEIENTVKETTKINKKYYMTSKYLSINGEDILATIYRDPEMIPGIIKGRAPIYDNELVITEIIADELDISMGDVVKVASKDEEREYIISGIYQSAYDVGITFSMSIKAAEKIGIDRIENATLALEDASKAQTVVDRLNERYSDIINADFIKKDRDFDMYQIAVDETKRVIYIFSVVFALVVVFMVCKKTFLKERTDIGIYKSLGFTADRLRLQFAVRFLLIAISGSLTGTAASLVFSKRLILVMLRFLGVTSFDTKFTVMTFALPIALICICFFIFSYIAAAQIKKVQVKELISE